MKGKTPFTGQPEKYFLPYQVAWIKDESPLKICEKGRQIGMTSADCYDSVRKAAVKGGLDVWVMSRDEIQARQYILQAKRWAKVLGYMVEHFGDRIFSSNGKAVCVQALRFESGAKIYGLSSNPDAIVGKTGHVKLDEFALHRNQRELYRVAKPVTQWGGTLSMISTHRGIATVFNELIRDVRERGNPMGWSLHSVPIQRAVEEGLVEKINAVRAKSTKFQAPSSREISNGKGRKRRVSGTATNSAGHAGSEKASIEAPLPAPSSQGEGEEAALATANGSVAQCGLPNVGTLLPRVKALGVNLVTDPRSDETRAGWLARIEAECLDQEQWLQEYCCVPADEAAAFISYELITACEAPGCMKDFEYLAACKNPLYLGFDVARKKDLSVIDVGEKIGDVIWDRLRIEMTKTTYAEQKFQLWRLLRLSKLGRAYIDATGIGNQLAEEAKYEFGYKVEPIVFTNPVKETLAYPLRAAFEEKKLRLDFDLKLRADLRGIKKETTTVGNFRFVGESEDSHCDRFWAKALRHHAAMQPEWVGPMVG